MDDKLTEIERLVRETFDLWDMLRVGFRWRHYSLNHTYRVTNLSVSMSVHEGADPYKLRCAGILHDITKPYDGEIIHCCHPGAIGLSNFMIGLICMVRSTTKAAQLLQSKCSGRLDIRRAMLVK